MGKMDLNLSKFISDCQQQVWCSSDIRRTLEQHGICLSPSNFYSPIPNREELNENFENYEGKPLPIYDRIFDKETISTFLESVSEYAKEFDPPFKGDEKSGSFFWENSQFSFTDAMVYYCIIRHTKPKWILEIGAGFSTLVANMAVLANGVGEVICIEPYPREWLLDIESVTKVIQKKVQDIPLKDLVRICESVDILFIDSTHNVKIGSDCNYLYLMLFPRIKNEYLLIHIHDIFLPFGMPVTWAKENQIFWTEQYLLYGYLLNNNKTEVVFGSSYSTTFLQSKIDALMDGKACSGGSSLWFRQCSSSINS